MLLIATNQYQYYEYHITELDKCRALFPNLHSFDNIKYITATMEVASKIRTLFTKDNTITIPWNSFDMAQVWYGDIAKTILANLLSNK